MLHRSQPWFQAIQRKRNAIAMSPQRDAPALPDQSRKGNFLEVPLDDLFGHLVHAIARSRRLASTWIRLDRARVKQAWTVARRAAPPVRKRELLPTRKQSRASAADATRDATPHHATFGAYPPYIVVDAVSSHRKSTKSLFSYTFFYTYTVWQHFFQSINQMYYQKHR